jgi:hypothetical protein
MVEQNLAQGARITQGGIKVAQKAKELTLRKLFRRGIWHSCRDYVEMVGELAYNDERNAKL